MIKVLHLGIKYWPYYYTYQNQSIEGIRGGGLDKYNYMLLNDLPDDVESYIFVQKLIGQSSREIINNIYIYRIKSFGSRASRQIICNIFSFIYAPFIIKKEKINIVHGHQQIGIFFAFLIGKIFSLPSIGTPYSFSTKENRFKFNKIAIWIEKNIYKKVNKLIFETDGNKILAEQELGISFLNSIVINTGIEIPEIKKSYTNSDIINFFFIGRLVKIKAIDNLILSLNFLEKQSLSKIKIHIIGEGEEFSSLKEIVIKNKFEKYIELHGFVKDTSRFYKDCDVFILPSYMEGLSIALLEAMSYGVASVTNNFNLPFDEETIIKMENNKPETIARTINFIINNRELLSQYGAKSREVIEKEYSIRSFSMRYFQLLTKL